MSDISLETKEGCILSVYSKEDKHFGFYVARAIQELSPNLNLSLNTPYRFSCVLERDENSHSFWDMYLVPVNEDQENE